MRLAAQGATQGRTLMATGSPVCLSLPFFTTANPGSAHVGVVGWLSRCRSFGWLAQTCTTGARARRAMLGRTSHAHGLANLIAIQEVLDGGCVGGGCDNTGWGLGPSACMHACVCMGASRAGASRASACVPVPAFTYTRARTHARTHARTLRDEPAALDGGKVHARPPFPQDCPPGAPLPSRMLHPAFLGLPRQGISTFFSS